MTMNYFKFKRSFELITKEQSDTFKYEKRKMIRKDIGCDVTQDNYRGL